VARLGFRDPDPFPEYPAPEVASWEPWAQRVAEDR
jgi:hypothetical protein